jgi:hypothetical protein
MVVERVAGRHDAMRAIAPSMPPHICPRQGRRRPTPSICIDPSMLSHVCPRQGRRRPRPKFCIAQSTPPHVSPRQGRRRPTPRHVSPQACIHRFNCRRRRRRHNGRLKHVVARPSRSSANDANPPKVHRGNGFVATCADNYGTIYSAPLYICRVVLLLLRQRPSSTEKGRRRCRPREQLLGNCNEHPQAANNGE